MSSPRLDPGDWLGKDIKSWAQGIRNGYVRAFILFTLHETGVFDLLRKGKPLTARQIAQRRNLDPNILEGILNFLYHADRILKKEGNRFSFSKYGEWLFTDMILTMSYGLIGAASCLLYELVPCLRGEKKYGVDFIRRGDLVAKGSYYTSCQNYPWIIDEFKKLGRQHRINSVKEKGRKGGTTTYERGVGCFAMYKKARKRASQKGGKKAGTISGRANYDAGIGLANLTREQLVKQGQKSAENRGTEGSKELGRKSALARGYAPYHYKRVETAHGLMHEDGYLLTLKRNKNLNWGEVAERVNRFFGNHRSLYGLKTEYFKLKRQEKTK